MTSDLAIWTLKTALKRQRAKLDGLILHSDQGSQFSSHEFTSFCAKNGVKQSMSRAGCPTDNAPIERFFNTLKSEFFQRFQITFSKTLFLVSTVSISPIHDNHNITPAENIHHAFETGLRKSGCDRFDALLTAD